MSYWRKISMSELERLVTSTRAILEKNQVLRTDLQQIVDICKDSVRCEGVNGTRMSKYEHLKEESASLSDQNVALKKEISMLQATVLNAKDIISRNEEITLNSVSVADSAADQLKMCESERLHVEQALMVLSQETSKFHVENMELKRELHELTIKHSILSKDSTDSLSSLNQKVLGFISREKELSNSLKSEREKVAVLVCENETLKNQYNEEKQKNDFHKFNAQGILFSQQNQLIDALQERIKNQQNLLNDVESQNDKISNERDNHLTELKSLQSKYQAALISSEIAISHKNAIIDRLASEINELKQKAENRMSGSHAELVKHNEFLIEEVASLRVKAEGVARDQSSADKKSEILISILRKENAELKSLALNYKINM